MEATGILPCPPPAAGTRALELWLGLLVTQSPVCGITSFGDTPGLGLHPPQRPHDEVSLQFCSDFQKPEMLLF